MIRLIITIPLLIILVLFTLSNNQAVRVGFWPTDYALEIPLSIVVLIGMGIAFLFGALFIWVGEIAQRRRARRAERTVALLEAQVRDLKSRVPRVAMSPPV